MQIFFQILSNFFSKILNYDLTDYLNMMIFIFPPNQITIPLTTINMLTDEVNTLTNCELGSINP